MNFLISRVPEAANFQQFPFALKVLRVLLLSSYIRRAIADWLLEEVFSLEFYEPAKRTVPHLQDWLADTRLVCHSHLRRLCLTFFLHLWRYAAYHGLTFTTLPKNDQDDMHRVPFRYSVIFGIYHILSDYQPIVDVFSLRKELGGFPPDNIDPVRYLVNYVKDEAKLMVKLEIDKVYYEFGEPVKVKMRLENRSDLAIDFNNRQNMVFKISAEFVEFKVQDQLHHPIKIPHKEKIFQSLRSDGLEMHHNRLFPKETILVDYDFIFTKKDIYTITALVYIPHYQEFVELMIGGINYGVPSSQLDQGLIETFCTM